MRIKRMINPKLLNRPHHVAVVHHPFCNVA
jgi:hypothetical protein